MAPATGIIPEDTGDTAPATVHGATHGATHDIEALAARLTAPLQACVLEVGQVRGRIDAAAVLDTTPADRIIDMYLDVIAPGWNTGELAAALHRTGALAAAALFPANSDGYFRTFCRHTISVMLADSERHLADGAGTGIDALVPRLHDVCAWALMHGWENGVAQALTAAAESAIARGQVGA